MKEQDFYELFGEIDPQIIADADKPVPFRQKRGFKIMLIAAVLAASILLTSIAGAFALAAGYFASLPDIEDTDPDGSTSEGKPGQDNAPGGLVGELFGGIDFGALKDALGADGNVNWQDVLSILRGEQPKDDPEYTNGYTFAAVDLADGTVKLVSYEGSGDAIEIPTKIFGKKVTVIGENAFAQNKEIRKVIVPDTVKVIEANAFSECSNLEAVQLPDSLQEIGDYAFSKCFSLSYLGTEEGALLPDSLHTLGAYAFLYCRELTSVTISPSLQVWGTRAFEGSGLQYLTIADGVNEIPDSAFSGCDQLMQITLPSSVTRIGNAAFFGCTRLESVTLNEGLVYLDACCFDSTAISSIVIPSTVTSFEEGMFYDCPNLKDVIFAGNAPEIFTRPGTPEQDRENIADYTVYYRLGADGFTRREWNGHTCMLMEVHTEQYVKDSGKSIVPMYNVEMLGQLNLWDSEDEVTVIESYAQYKQYASVLNSTRYDPEYFRQYAIVLVKVKHASTERVAGVGGIIARLYTTGGVYYLALDPVIAMDTPKANTNDELYTYIAIDVERADIRTDDVVRVGEVYAYSISDFAFGGSVYHESYIEEYLNGK